MSNDNDREPVSDARLEAWIGAYALLTERWYGGTAPHWNMNESPMTAPDVLGVLRELQERRRVQAPLEALVAACRDAIGRIDKVWL